jgi:hypothetical protein
MIIWSGWGILACVFWGVGLFLTQLLIDKLFAPGYYAAHEWCMILASSISAPLIWVVGRALNGSPDSDRRQSQSARHTLFFIPMEYWGPLFVGIGVVIAMVHATKP